MAEADLVRPSTSCSGASGLQRRFLLSSPGRPRTATGHSEPNSTPTPPAGLAVRVCIKFQPSIDLAYERQYQTSYSFEPTDQICHALLRRLTHCSNELLTRRDSTALERAIPQIGDGKPLRFELIYQIYRGGPEPWATRSFKSYQKHPMDKPSAMEVARSTDRIIGSFMKVHDASFRWMHGRMRERSGSDLELLKPLSNPVSLLHIPQARFIDATQDWDFTPGYEITLHFRSRCKSRRQREWERTITLRSGQGSPLTLSHGEDMAWVLSTAMQRALDSRKMAFDRQHRSCNKFDFLEECHHSEQNAVHVGFQIRNRLGLDHRHLRRELDSNLLLFQRADGLDCEEFVGQLEHAFSAVRDDTDKELNDMDDLRLAVYELSGRGWKAEKPFAVCLDSTACYSRRTIKAILDRVQTGVADVLGGNDMCITLMVHKRGHLVLDKTLVARSPYYATGQRQDENPETAKDKFLAKLKNRIRSDISMVVKDTCALSDCEPQNIRVIERPVPAADDPAEMEALPSSSPLPIPTPSGSVPNSFDGSSGQPSEPLGQQSETPQSHGGVDADAGACDDAAGLPQRPETPAKASRPALDSHFGSGRSTLSLSTTEDGETTYQSSSSTPSLVDGDTGTPRESLLVTPTFMRTLSGRPQPFDANPNIADSETSDSELVEDSIVRASTPTMQRFNEPRQFSLLGKGSRSVSRQSLASFESSEGASMVESESSLEPSAETEAPTAQATELMCESRSLATPAQAPVPSAASPGAQHETAAPEPFLGGWLEYCCVPVDEEEAPAKLESATERHARQSEVPVGEEPVIVVTPVEEEVEPASPCPLEGFLEYTIETIIEEAEEEYSDVEFHDAADSTAELDLLSSPSSFATAAESGLNSPLSLDYATSSVNMDHAVPSPSPMASSSPSLDFTSPSPLEVTKSDANVVDVADTPVEVVELEACTSSFETMKLEAIPAPAEPVPAPVPAPASTAEIIEPSPLPNSELPSAPSEHLESLLELHEAPSLPDMNAAMSVTSDAPCTPTSESAFSFSSKNEPREPSTPPPLMTETEDSDYSEPSEPTLPFPDLPVTAEPTIHSDSPRSLSLWRPSQNFFEDSSDAYLGPMRKLSIRRPLFARPSSSGAALGQSFSHKRQFSSPTAGLFGFQEPRRIDIGLRGALFGLAALRKSGKLERSSSQVLLKLENDRGVVVVPGSLSASNSRRNSLNMGIGGAGVLGLGNVFAF
ncbi:hypothetical protein Cob_v009328 [Colletotrichum orbiculare MAFF 240422]|uniref:Uncharacterized protein n=1 Tax=Colletotrichum orbiculare (strain 104-T / ATCC 96160 / CBS 514.97 / LARS 414 / MAFF 240422) TaxID=1213857 RepID=N4VYL1_COLOR|nr:hypothetical protein Cob_v009328 [Colletotrichum orbiculare MAFF 240422]